MKKVLLNRRAISLLSVLIILLIFVSCRKEDNSVNPNDNPVTKYGNINGKVVTTGGLGLSGVAVSVGTQTAFTDEKGGFILTKIGVGDRVLVNFKSDNYVSTQKVVSVKANRTVDIDASMIQIGKKTTVSGASGGIVQFGTAKLDFPSNAFTDSKGIMYSGNVQVNATYFDPSADAFLGCFPGEFNGTRTDNSESQIESFGFINVELLNGTEKMQIASGKQVTITVPISAKLLAKAPTTIPLWYYDDTKGKWIEEGSATKTGNTYVGTVKHFSNWNCDMPTQTSYLQGKVVDKNGDPISFARVFSIGADYTGQSSALTADDGTFKVAVKSSSNAKIFAKYHIFSSDTVSYATPATGIIQDIANVVIKVDTMNVVIIVGKIVDNGNLPVQYAYIKLIDSANHATDMISTNVDGRFKLFGSINKSYVIEVQTYNYDTTGGKPKFNLTTGSTNETIDMGDLKIDVGGATVIGRVVDSLSNPLAKVYVYSTEGGNPNSGTSREKMTDSTGKFSLWVRPNKTFNIIFYYNQKSKTVSASSGNLGETKDIGDIILK